MARLNNHQLAGQLKRIADLMEIKGENRFKTLAYRRAAESILSLGREVEDVWQAGELKEVPHIGKAIYEKIDELMTTGELTFWQKLTAEVPESLVDVLAVPGLGPKTAKTLWRHLNVKTLEDLKIAAEAGYLKGLPGLGAKTQAKILAGIEALAKHENQGFNLAVAWSTAREIIKALETLPEVLGIEPAGSLRRYVPTIGDLDILVATEQAEPVMAAFKTLAGIEEVLLTGPRKTSIRFANGLQADLRCLERQHWGTAMQYFTGSQAHNVKIRELAQKQGLRLNEYALTRSDSGAQGEQILCLDEVAVYQALGLPFIPPILREDRGEIEAALQDDLPNLVQLSDIRGEVHCHSTWSDGKHTIEEMAQAAIERGYDYLVLTDHSQSLGIANGLTPERLCQQRQEIEAVQARLPQIRLLQGSEVEIKADGSLDFENDVLAELDFVVASVHTGLRQNREWLTKRMLNAIYNPHVRVIGHPSGRLLGRREGGDFDMDALLHAAAETGTIMEINASPSRLDLDSVYVKRAIALGVKLIVNCDAHCVEGFDELPYGIATAQRGWATRQDISNTLSLEQLLSLKK